jgi:hypothetical protein
MTYQLPPKPHRFTPERKKHRVPNPATRKCLNLEKCREVPDVIGLNYLLVSIHVPIPPTSLSGEVPLALFAESLVEVWKLEAGSWKLEAA